VATANAIQEDARGGGAPRACARAIGMDMAEWWEATNESFFAHVRKAESIAVVAEVADGAVAGLDWLKKDELTAEAERRVAGKRWLPALLRAEDA